jgi:hypothetical protein
MLYELTLAIFMFLIGLLCAEFGLSTKQLAFLFVGGIIWLVTGVYTLTGNVIQGVSYTFYNMSYTASGQLSSVNATTSYLRLNNGSDMSNLATAGLIGYALLGLGLYLMWLAILEMWNDRAAKLEAKRQGRV